MDGGGGFCVSACVIGCDIEISFYLDLYLMNLNGFLACNQIFFNVVFIVFQKALLYKLQ